MSLDKTPVSRLQELTQQTSKPLPIYFYSYSVEDTSTLFNCTVTVDGVTATGYGKTKKEAKHKSAEQALLKLGLTKEQNLGNKFQIANMQEDNNWQNINYVGKLNEFCLSNRVECPKYLDVGYKGNNFLIKCMLLQEETVGAGLNKKLAKQAAAREMLKKIETIDVQRLVNFPIPKKLEYGDKEIKQLSDMFCKLTTSGKLVPKTSINFSSEMELSSDLECSEDKLILKQQEENIPSESECRNELATLNVRYEIKTFLEKPLILIFKAEQVSGIQFTLMETGDTYSVVLNKLLAKAVEYLRILKQS